jgi:hypothetical protein
MSLAKLRPSPKAGDIIKLGFGYISGLTNKKFKVINFNSINFTLVIQPLDFDFDFNYSRALRRLVSSFVNRQLCIGTGGEIVILRHESATSEDLKAISYV